MKNNTINRYFQALPLKEKIIMLTENSEYERAVETFLEETKTTIS
jgi:hypothetical protein